MLSKKIIQDFQLTSLENIENFMEKNLTPKNKTWGGRQFVVKNQGKEYHFKLNDLVKQLIQVAKTDTHKEKLNTIISKIRTLDKKGDLKLKKANPFQKLLTAIRRAFGNSNFDRNQILNDLERLSISVPPKVSVTPKAQVTTVYKPNMRGKIYERLGGTSDHTWKTYSFRIEGDSNKTPFTVKVGTYNLMDKCVASGTTKQGAPIIANNPIDEAEDVRAYVERKKAQFEEIRLLIQGGTFDETLVNGVDAFVFQEVDFLQARNFTQPVQSWQIPYDLAYKAFCNMLEECGWRMLATDPTLTKKEQDPFITIYDPKKLKPQTENLQGCFSQVPHGTQPQFRGAEAIFTHRATGREVKIANLHLAYSQDPQTAIEAYQDAQIAANLPTIALGDLNRAPNKGKLSSAVIDWNYPSNVDAEMDANSQRIKGTLIIKDAQDPTKNKAYDAALASPSHTERIIITETETAYFEKQDVTPQSPVQVKYTSINRSHPSLIGRAWKRNRELLKELQEKHGLETDPAKKQALRLEIAAVQANLAG